MRAPPPLSAVASGPPPGAPRGARRAGGPARPTTCALGRSAPACAPRGSHLGRIRSECPAASRLPRKTPSRGGESSLPRSPSRRPARQPPRVFSVARAPFASRTTRLVPNVRLWSGPLAHRRPRCAADTRSPSPPEHAERRARAHAGGRTPSGVRVRCDACVTPTSRPPNAQVAQGEGATAAGRCGACSRRAPGSAWPLGGRVRPTAHALRPCVPARARGGCHRA